jgi:uncharacterized membrane protein
MALEKIKDIGEKYAAGLEAGRKGVEQVGTLVKGVQQLRGSMKGGNGGGPIEKAQGAAQGVKKLAQAAKGGKDPKVVKTAHLIQEQIDVAVPRRTAYDQWTQFKRFASLMKGIENVDQRVDDKVTWEAKIGPVRRKWKTQITEQVPDERIAWKSTGGVDTVGVVTFHSLGPRLTRTMLQMEYHPKGLVEGIGNLLRIQRRRARRDLKLYKNYLELAGTATGGWRGTIKKKEDLKTEGSNEEAAGSTGDDEDKGRKGNGSRSSSRPKAKSGGRRSSSQRRQSGTARQRKSA